MTREAPAWLAELQSRFGAVVRTPLDRSSGTLTATPTAYDAAAAADALDGPSITAVERLAVYNRQYWFRLFDLLQTIFPLTTSLVGPWSFNAYAARFLAECPPRGWDIERAADGFDSFLERALDAGGEDARLALVEGLRIDAAWHAVSRAPECAPFRPSAEDASRLLDARLVPSPAVAFVEEHFPLLELRRAGSGDAAAGRLAMTPRLARARSWALARRADGVLQIPLEPREAELLALLRSLSVRDALAKLEMACRPEERVELPPRAQAWLARSVQAGFWVGLTPAGG